MGIAALSVWGMYYLVNIVQSGNEYVKSADLEAYSWIEGHTEEHARFVISSFKFPFLPGWVVDSYGGYWIPLLTNRQTLVPPMIYTLEKSSNQELVKELQEYNRFQFEIDSVRSIEFISDNQIDYVYIGDQSGSMDADQFMDSQQYQLVYVSGNIHILKIAIE